MPAVSKSQQKFFGIVRAIQKGEMAPTTPETAKAAATMKKKDVKDFASTKHKGLPDKKEVEEAYYGGEEQRKKDEKKKKIDAFMDRAMPKRTFDQLGRETDRRTGKLKNEMFDIDPKAHRQQQRAKKIRNLSQKGSTEGEREAASRKTKGPKMFGESQCNKKKTLKEFLESI
tara:strand:- start:1438 stop:1953 length:516 start_codon:yes stop_codon:yes gene_type:complete